MTEQRINHVAEAISHAQIAAGSCGQIENRNGDIAVAQQIEAQTQALISQVYATLALVEQQKIANRIAIAQFRVGVNDLPHLRHLAVEPFGHDSLRPVAEVREALGL